MENKDFLLDRFDKQTFDGLYKSKKKLLGVGTGDDKNLFIIPDVNSTLIWWRDNSGYETTVFDGIGLKTEQEFDQLFELLGIDKLLKW